MALGNSNSFEFPSIHIPSLMRNGIELVHIVVPACPFRYKYLKFSSKVSYQITKSLRCNCSSCRVYMYMTHIVVCKQPGYKFLLYFSYTLISILTKTNSIVSHTILHALIEPDCIATEITVLCHKMYYSSTFYSLIVNW